MPRGQVKWFDPKKGYGFIVGPEGQDVFVHYSHIVADGFKSLKDGQWVDYELLQGEKGWQARTVQATDSSSGERVGTETETGETQPPPLASGYEPPPDEDEQDAASPRRTSGYEGADD